MEYGKNFASIHEVGNLILPRKSYGFSFLSLPGVCGLSLFAVYGYHLKINANATASVIFMKTPHIA